MQQTSAHSQGILHNNTSVLYLSKHADSHLNINENPIFQQYKFREDKFENFVFK